MSGLELNKIIAAILVACLIAMIVGKVANILYKPEIVVANRGYQVEVTQQELSKPGAEAPIEINIPDLMAKANAENGKKIFSKCLSCHSFDKNGANKVGPNLWAVYGANKGHKSDFPYSPALLAKGGKWSDDELYHFLNRPSKFIIGTKMSFAGLSKPGDIADVISFLKTLSD